MALYLSSSSEVCWPFVCGAAARGDDGTEFEEFCGPCIKVVKYKHQTSRR